MAGPAAELRTFTVPLVTTCWLVAVGGAANTDVVVRKRIEATVRRMARKMEEPGRQTHLGSAAASENESTQREKGENLIMTGEGETEFMGR